MERLGQRIRKNLRLATKGPRKIYWEYGFLAMLIMLPLLKPGFIFALDMVFTPHLPMPDTINNQYLFNVLLHVLNYVVPGQVIQKVILFAILVLCGVGAHRLVEFLGTKKSGDHLFAAQWGAYFAGILFMVNPFTYSRLITGQYLVLVGYALIPFFIMALWRFLADPTIKRTLVLAAWAIAISILSIHSVFFMALIIVISLAAFAGRYKSHYKKVLGYGLVTAGLWLLVSSYWLLPLAQGTSTEATLINGFDQRFTQNFQTATDPNYGVVFNAAALYGFWVDREQRYELPKDYMPVWPLLAAVIMVLAIAGAVWGYKKGRRAEVTTLAILGVTALVLGLGIAYKPLAPLYYWMIEHVPLYQGYREPQKFIGLLALAYAVLGGLAINVLLEQLKRAKPASYYRQLKLAIWLPAALLIVPIIYTPLMYWGLAGQLKSTDYPADWYDLNRQLNKDDSNFKVLFFPWHQYMLFSFTGTVIANPADRFFKKPVIQGDNLEFAGIFRQESSPETLYVENKILRPHFEITDAGNRLNEINVKYVVVAKNSDASRYDFLGNQTELELISDSDNLLVYRNTAFGR